MHDQTKMGHAKAGVAISKSTNTLRQRFLLTIAAATLASGVASGVAGAAGYGGDGESPECEAIGCPNGNRNCATLTGTFKMPFYVPLSAWMPYLGDFAYTEMPFSATCYEPPAY